ncbi:MAG: MarR family winged helix-turn-helix transcriptional regulator [Eubacteriales bacterium]|nr:MarR family winged helix-turn-helix transcriptional regulator [Eubacteriales bacterium]
MEREREITARPEGASGEQTIEGWRAEYNRLYKELDYYYFEAAAKANLSETAFWILYSICDSPEPWTQSELCREWYYSKQTINSAVKRLEQMGFVELKASKGRGNRKILALTETGRRYCDEEIMPLIQAELDAFSAFSQEEGELLLSLMRRQLKHMKERVGMSCR